MSASDLSKLKLSYTCRDLKQLIYQDVSQSQGIISYLDMSSNIKVKAACTPKEEKKN